MKWTFYALGFLLALLLESSVLGHRTFFGSKISLVPSYVCCVACREGHENGGWFAVAATLFWALSGVTGGPMFMFLLPAASILASFVCNTWLTRSLFPALAGCLLATALCHVGVYLQRLYMDYPLPPDALRITIIQLLCSMVPAPLLWWETRLIERFGGSNRT